MNRSLVPFCVIFGLLSIFACPISQSSEWFWEITNFPSGLDPRSGVAVADAIIVPTYVLNECTGTIYRSLNRGDTWEIVTAFTDKTLLKSIVVSTSGILFLLLYDCLDQKGEVLYSLNLGSDWLSTGELPAFTNFSSAKIWIDSNDILYVSGNFDSEAGQCVIKSINGGTNWIEAGLFPVGSRVQTLHPVENNKIFAGTFDAEIFESEDGGQSWDFMTNLTHIRISTMEDIPDTRIFAGSSFCHIISSCEWNNTSEWYELAHLEEVENVHKVFYSSQGYLYAGGMPTEYASSILESIDNGESWTLMNVEVSTETVRFFFESLDGYLYAIGTNGVHRSSEPITPHTPTPTVGPGTPTYTPHPPSFTPTSLPTYTPSPTHTPAPPTSMPTATPICESLGVNLILPSDYFTAGSIFFLNIEVCNPLNHSLIDVPLFVILEIENMFWFGPSWSVNLDYYHRDWEVGITNEGVIDEFAWPANSGFYSGALFWAALTNPSSTEILGEYDFWEFGWGE